MKGNHFLPVILATSLLVACGGGGGGGSSQPASTQLSGTASKGIFDNAVVTAFAVTSGNKGAQLGQTRTDATGQYSLALNSHTGPVLLELSTDADSRMICDVPAGCGAVAFGAPVTLPVGFTLRSALPQGGGTVKAAITPFTDLATRLAASGSGGLSTTSISSAMNQVADLFALPPLTSTQPVDLTAANLGPDGNAQRYALLNAAIAQLANGNPADLAGKLDGLAAALLAGNGQLVNDTTDPAVTTDLASVLQAALTVSQAPSVAGKLSPVVAVIIDEGLTTAVAAGETPTEASGTGSTGGSGLALAKAFIDQAHDLVQSVLQADNATVQGEIDAKLTSIDLLQADVDNHPQRLGDALKVSHELMLDLVESLIADPGIDTSLDSSEANARLPGLRYNNFGELDIAFGSGFTLNLNPATRSATISGPITVRRYNVEQWGCLSEPCARTEIGSPVTFTVTNLVFAYPDVNTAGTQFFYGITSNGTVESSKLKLAFTAGAGTTGTGLTATYATAATLASHMAAMDDDDESNDLAHLPATARLALNNATLTVKDSPADHFSQFTGTASFTLNQATLPLVNGLTGTARSIVPSRLSVVGTFSSVAGESLVASLSVDLDDNLANQALVSPETGYERLSGVFTQTYDAVNSVVTIKPTAGNIFYASSYGWPTYDELRLKLSPFDGQDCLRMELRQDGMTVEDYGYFDCQASGTPLLQVLQAALAPNGNMWTTLMYYSQVSIEGEGDYVPVMDTLASTRAKLIWSNEDLAQDATRFARGAFSATLKINLDGSASLDHEVKVSGHRTSFQGGDVNMRFTNFVTGKWLELNAIGTDYKLLTAATVTNQDGASIVLNPVKLLDADDSNDEVDILVNGTVYGKLYEAAGMYLARFTDNSFTML